MSFPRYERYKDSGVDWLGEVPEHWQVKRLKFSARLVTDKATERTNPVALENIESWTGRLLPSDTEFEGDGTAFRTGDVLFGKLRAYLAKAHLADRAGEAVGDFHVLRPVKGLLGEFFIRQLLNRDAIEIIDGSTFGAKMPRVSWEFLSSMPILTPPEDEQASIANFVSVEAANIDALIEKQRRLIELLKEKRQAVICHAVTNGLNNKVPLKGSEIGWLGATPAHWRRLRIGAIFQEVTDAGVDGLPILSVSIHHGVSDKQLDDEEMDRMVVRSDDQTKYKRVRSGDLVYNMMRAWQGGFGTVNVEGMVSPAYVVARPSSGYLSRFVEFILRTPCAVEEMRRYSQGVTDFRLRLYWDKFKCIQLSMPPLSEQEDILAYIDTKTTEFDRLTEVSERAISILIERRNALISAAVTGKIDVRFSMRKGVASVKPYTSAFAHQVLAAKILASCNDSHMGRTKLQKLIHVTEYHAQIEDLRGNYTRKMAGPLNMKAMISLEQGLEKQRWYKTVSSDKRYRYIPLDKHERHSKYMEHWNDKAERINQVLSLMGNMTMHQCEIVSTLYAAWNDLMIDQLPATDEAILAQASTAAGWHKKQEHTPYAKWVAALGWMKKVGLVPTGFGTHTRKVTPEEAHEPA